MTMIGKRIVKEGENIRGKNHWYNHILTTTIKPSEFIQDKFSCDRK